MSAFQVGMSFAEKTSLARKKKSQREKRIMRLENYYRNYLITAHPEAKPKDHVSPKESIHSDSALLKSNL
jgi:hypothetical protein